MHHQHQYQQQHKHHRLKSWPDFLFRDQPLNHVVLKMQLGDQTLTLDPSRSPSPPPPPTDPTALLSDELLLRILSAAAAADSQTPLVCRRWRRLLDLLRRSLAPLDFSSIETLPLRFPNLEDLDLVPASFVSPSSPSGVVLTRGSVSIPLDPFSDLGECQFRPPDVVDRGLETLARGLPSLRRLAIAAAVSESGLMAVAAECPTLQELELHRCTDRALRPISAFGNLQILRLVGSVEGMYGGTGVTDIGLTILAHGCKRLVKLELSGCEGSYDGISAVGRCCFMLEELTICDHRMDAGWLAALSFCGNLKTLRLQSCRVIDADPGPEEHLGSCPAIERLQMQRSQLRDRRSLKALFLVCKAVREMMFHDCWGMDNDTFGIANNCRRVKSLCVEGCSRLTTEGLESVILSWVDLQSLVVVSCNNIRDDEVSPALANLFSVLKELKWRPDSKSVLATNFAGTGMRNKGGRFFKRL